MKFIVPILLVFTFNVSADNTLRPSPNNKIGHSKKAMQLNQESFFYKLFNDELGNNSTSLSKNNDEILSQIERLAEFRERGILSEEEFQTKKSLLLEKIK